VSVGYKTDIRLHSLDFEEFLRAQGYGDELIERVYAHLVERRPFDELEKKLLDEKFLDFCVLGGMPRVVSMFLANGTFEGSLAAQLDDESQQDLRTNQNLGVYKGGLYENVVGDALVKQGFPLAYYRKEDSTLEQDFFVRTTSRLVPVEVKARGGCAQSLKTLIKSDHYEDIVWGIKLHGGNVGWENRVLTLPCFTAFLLRRFLSEHGDDAQFN
jgi:predicted AAA+ superfamily ATPase